MAAGSKIAVEVTANSSELQAAVVKASDALKNLAKIVTTTSVESAKAGDSIIAKNREIANSFTSTWKVAQNSSSTIKSSYVEMGKAADAGAATVTKANEEIDASNEKTADTSKKTADKVGIGWGVAGSGITKAGKDISLALAGIAAGGVYMAAKFQQATTQFNTQAGASLKQTQKLKQGILDMAGAVGQTPDQLAGGMYHIVSSLNNLIPAAQRTKVELGVLKEAAIGAAVGGSNLTETTYALSGVMNALGQTTVPEATKTMAELNAIVGAGDMHMQDLVNALSTGIIPAARTFGISLKSVGAALDVMTDSGIPAEQAATRLRMGLTMMAAPTKMATKILQDLGLSSKQAISSESDMSKILEKAGVSTTQMASDLRQPDGILVALDDLKQHLEQSGLSATGAAAVIARAFGGARSGTAIESLINNLTKLQSKYGQVSTTSNQFGTDWQRTQNTMVFQWHQLEAAVQSFLVLIGSGLMPVVETMVNGLKDVVDWLGKNKTAAELLGGAIGVTLATAVASFATVKAVAFITAAGNMLKAMQNLASWLTGGFIPAVKKMATEEAVAKDAIVADNEAIGASFSALLGPIGLVSVAILGLSQLPWNSINKSINGALGLGGGQSNLVPAGITTQAQLKAYLEKTMGWLGSADVNKVFNAEKGQLPNAAGGLTGAQSFAGTITAALSAPSGTSTTGTQVMAYLMKSLGLTKNQAAGVVGNLAVEDPNFKGTTVQGGSQSGTIVPGTGYGLAQWTTTGRQQQLQALAQQMGLPVGSIKVQEAMITQELQSGNYGLSALKQAQTPQQAAAAFEKYYENALNGGDLPLRESNAAGYAGMSLGGVPVGGGVTAASQQTGTTPIGTTAAQQKAMAAIINAVTSQGGKNLKTLQSKYLVSGKQPVGLNDWNQLQNAGMGSAEQIATKYVLAEQKAAAEAQKKAAAVLVTDNKNGQAELNTMITAVHSQSLSQLNTQLNATNESKMNQLILTLDNTHNKNLVQMADRIESEYQTELKAQTQLQIQANQTAYGKLIASTSSAQQKASSDLGTLFSAGTSLGIAGNTAITGALAQEGGISGNVTGAALSPVLAALIPQLEANPGKLSGSMASQYAAIFGSNSALGTEFGALGGGGLNAADTGTAYDTIYSLISSLASLQTAVGDNTNAVTDNTDNLVSLLQQQNTTLSEKVALGAAQTAVIAGMIPQIPHFASGGPVISDGLAYVHGGEHVVPQGGTLVSNGASQSVVHVHNHIHGDPNGLVSAIDSRVLHPSTIQAISGRIGQRTTQLQGAPGGFRGYGR